MKLDVVIVLDFRLGVVHENDGVVVSHSHVSRRYWLLVFEVAVGLEKGTPAGVEGPHLIQYIAATTIRHGQILSLRRVHLAYLECTPLVCEMLDDWNFDVRTCPPGNLDFLLEIHTKRTPKCATTLHVTSPILVDPEDSSGATGPGGGGVETGRHSATSGRHIRGPIPSTWQLVHHVVGVQ